MISAMSAAAGGTIKNVDRNRLQREVGARIGYALKSGTELFVQGAYDLRAMTIPSTISALRAIRRLSLIAGLRGNLGRLFTGGALRRMAEAAL